MYSSVIIPQTSIEIHAILPGMLSLLSPDVLPAPYQERVHWKMVTCAVSFVYIVSQYALLTSGKNWNKNTVDSQFSRDGGIQFSVKPMVIISGCLRVDFDCWRYLGEMSIASMSSPKYRLRDSPCTRFQPCRIVQGCSALPKALHDWFIFLLYHSITLPFPHLHLRHPALSPTAEPKHAHRLRNASFTPILRHSPQSLQLLPLLLPHLINLQPPTPKDPLYPRLLLQPANSGPPTNSNIRSPTRHPLLSISKTTPPPPRNTKCR